MKKLNGLLICSMLLYLASSSNLIFAQEKSVSVNAYASQNLSLDPYGRIIDVFFDEDAAVIAPWDRFRFTLDIVQPLGRNGGAFIGDLNNDQINDLLIATFDGQVLFYPGIAGKYNQFGNGSLLKFTKSSIEDDPYIYDNIGPGSWLEGDIADLDGDGKNEIVIGERIYRNISLSSEPVLELVYDFNLSVWDITPSIGDLNSDGKPDIVLCLSYSLTTKICWNNSTPGTFAFTVDVLNTWTSFTSNDHLSVADLNGDELPDLASPGGIYFNTGTAQVHQFNFSSPSPWNKTGGPSWAATSDQPPHIYLKDVDNDGLIEAFASNLSTTLWQVYYYRNTGTSSSHQFNYSGPLVTKSTPLNICFRGDSDPSFSPKRGFVATGDIDGNSYEDLLLSIDGGESFGYPTILWNFNNTDLTQPSLTYPDIFTYPELPEITSVCDFFNSYCDYLAKPANSFSGWSDFSNDGLPDIIQCDQWMDAYQLYLIVRNGQWPFEKGNKQAIITQPSGAQAVAMGVVIIDIDKDGRKDIVGGSEDGKLKYFRNLATDGTLSLADPVFLSDLSSNPLVLGTQSWPTAIDLNGDGNMDFLVATTDGRIHKVMCQTPGVSNGFVLDGLLGSVEQNPIDITHIAGGGTITPSLTAIDIDKDELMDVVMADAQGSGWLLHNTGTKTTPVFSLKPLIVSKTNSANLVKIDNRHYRVYFALPPIPDETKLSFNEISINNTLVSGEALITPAVFHEIVAGANNPVAGTVTGSGTYNHGQTVSLTATASLGFKFANWTENGSEVSTDAAYKFIATSDRNLVSNFQIAAGIEKLFEKSSVTIFPNPSNGKFAIGLDNNYFGEITLKITSVTGSYSKIYKFDKPTEKFEFIVEMENMGKGIYFVNLQTPNDKVVKVVVLK